MSTDPNIPVLSISYATIKITIAVVASMMKFEF